MQKTAGAPGAPEPKKRDREVGHRRRLALSALLACVALIGAVSLGALAQSPTPAEETAAPPAGTRAATPPEASGVVAGEMVTPVPPEPTPTPTPTPVPAFDFTQPAPERLPVEDDWFITGEHPMEKENYIPFVAFLQGDRVQLVRQYPEWNLQLRIPKRAHGTLLWYDTCKGLFFQLL